MIMAYSDWYHQLVSHFKLNDEHTPVQGSGIRIRNTVFISEPSQLNDGNFNDLSIKENYNFSYPVFIPESPDSKKVILLLHGLNERNWNKYLTWAYSLASDTGSYVVLFPISFHINRSPGSWKDVRLMQDFVKVRSSNIGHDKMSTFANVALSNRLTEDPLRFFVSGCQTSEDIIRLVLSIKNGDHPLIPTDSSINLFAYSIGAFLAEIMMIGNPQGIFTSSKLFILCGGSVFSNMNGTSRLIMDRLAFDSLFSFYLNDFEDSIRTNRRLNDFFNQSPLGVAFRSMIDFGRYRIFRQEKIRTLSGQINSIALKNDKVIPAEGIMATLGFGRKHPAVEVLDFPYQYTHENPFPILSPPYDSLVNEAFTQVFSRAARFLS
jgi:hypothetical protein